jgi:SNF2 family DNA or RNA helicase
MTRPYSTVIYKDEFHKSDPTFMEVECDMNADQKREYTSMKEELLAVIDGEKVTAGNVLVQMQKLLQIASGFIIDEDGTIRWISDNKVKPVLDLCETLDEKAIIFAPFTALQDRICEELGDDVVRYSKSSDVDLWDTATGPRFICGHQGSGLGIGQNLQRACATLYVGNTFSAEARWQSIYRTDRIGQEKQVRYWDFMAPGTLDQVVLKNLAGKRELRDASLSALRGIIE